MVVAWRSSYCTLSGPASADARGQIEIRYRGRRMRWTEILSPAAPAPASCPARLQRGPRLMGKRRKGQGPDHHWHHVFGAHPNYLAFQKDRRAWERIQPDLEPGTLVE